MIQKLNNFIDTYLPSLLDQSDVWQSLDVDYSAPRVERLWMQIDGFRYYLHVIHKTDEVCLFHKHVWQSAIKLLRGSYEMGIAYSEKEVTNEDAYQLPIACTSIFTEGSVYSMTTSHGLHYVKPLTDTTLSIMVSGNLYPEPRKEVVNKKLLPLSEARKLEILELFRQCLVG